MFLYLSLCVATRLYPKLNSGTSSVSSGQESSSTAAHLQTHRQYPVLTSSGDSRGATYNSFNTVQQVSQPSRLTGNVSTVGSPLSQEQFQGNVVFSYYVHIPLKQLVLCQVFPEMYKTLYNLLVCVLKK